MSTRRQVLRRAVGAGAAYTAALASVRISAGEAAPATAPVVEHQQFLRQLLPDREDQEVAMITVAYAPGGSSPPHRHPCPVFAYVLEGAVVSQVDGEPPTTYHAGQTFYETPNGVHAVSRNASTTQPAKLLVFFVAHRGQTLTAPVEQ